MSMMQVLKLKPAFTDQQAEALAGLFDEEIATKRDLEALRISAKTELEVVKLELQAVKAELKADIEKLRLEVQRDIKGVEARLIQVVLGQGAATIGILFALLHFIGK